MNRKIRWHSGFTMIELLIVILVISILAAISFAYLTEVRKRANETSAMGTMKALVNVEEVYRERNPGYADMSALLAQNLVDTSIAVTGKSGYYFAVAGVTVSQYFVTGVPQSTGSGTRYFYADEAGTIFESDTVTSAPTADTNGIPPPGFTQAGN